MFERVLYSCFFYFKKAFQKKLNTLTNLSERVKNDTSQAFKIAFNSFVALALIWKYKVNSLYESFKQTQFMVENR